MHSGTGRIARMLMRPMSLYESEDSSEVSLSELFKTNTITPCRSVKTVHDIAYLICRGGWPQSIQALERKALLIMRQYIESIYNHDISRIDNTKTDPSRVESFLRAYARHIQTMATQKTLLADIKENDITFTEPTLYSYLDKLKRLFIIEETPAWAPNIRSKTAIRTSSKKGFIDPSLAVSILHLSSEMLLKDFEYFGFLFESLCLRDLRVYTDVLEGEILHYHDNIGLECDAIIRLPQGPYALVEIKLGGRLEEDAARNLMRLETLLVEKKRSKPAFKMILTAGEYGYTRPDGIHIVPLACLRD